MRIGHGFDVHQIIPGKGMILGGVFIESEFSIEAHSDGDLIIHALMDALLGAAGYGDIGTYFPSNDNKYKNVSSRELLRKVIEILHDNNFIVVNIDITFVGQEPRLIPHIPFIKRNLAQDLLIKEEFINCKATTTDFLGFEGEKKGLSCHAVALIK
jgi:2-C-methyl-D-erythritol 2,4-cyclodiphosphate synthase|tara:strand:+ start:1696 stop:2163 length:468 start_codon:yes stop_codon:yes gene_type:complete